MYRTIEIYSDKRFALRQIGQKYFYLSYILKHQLFSENKFNFRLEKYDFFKETVK